jgi:hypothetical protein
MISPFNLIVTVFFIFISFSLSKHIFIILVFFRIEASSFFL